MKRYNLGNGSEVLVLYEGIIVINENQIEDKIETDSCHAKDIVFLNVFNDNVIFAFENENDNLEYIGVYDTTNLESKIIESIPTHIGTIIDGNIQYHSINIKSIHGDIKDPFRFAISTKGDKHYLIVFDFGINNSVYFRELEPNRNINHIYWDESANKDLTLVYDNGLRVNISKSRYETQTPQLSDFLEDDMESEIITFHDKSTSSVQVLTVKDILHDHSTHFQLNEWWSGEGFDLTIDRKNDKVHIALTTEEIVGLKRLFEDIK
jgi:hypothetical protein